MSIQASENDIKERLSVAYITAVAARAGCQVAKFDIDKASIDAIISPISGRKSQVYLQLKATSQNLVDNEEVKFSLPIKNYNDLRDTNTIIPHYLILFALPPDPDRWLQISSTELAIRGVAYYGSLWGLPAVINTTTRTVIMPENQQFDVSILERMITTCPNRIGRAK